MEEASLQLVNIEKIYGTANMKIKALKGVSISFRKNEFVSILGPSGCGKTTMLNIIGGLDRYTSGDLIINGVSTKKYTDKDWDTYRNHRIGFVFQSYNLIPHQSVIANVELALTLSGVNKSERRKRALKVLEKVGLKGVENKKPNQLSGGQMQRVAIARALVNDPEIILADEPTGALDTKTSIQVLDLLKEVAKDRLVIMVTHNPELAKEYSTRIINLLDGKVTGDTQPFEAPVQKDKNPSPMKRAIMKFRTAFGLSFSNLRTKRGRTILTSISGSIGIIGIALVLAMSTGFSAYVNRLQADTLSVYPVTINESTIDLSDFQELTNKEISDERVRQLVEQKATEKIYSKNMFDMLTNMLKSNDINQEGYVKYIEDFVEEKNASVPSDTWAYSLKKDYGFDVNDYIFSNITVNMNKTGTPTSSVMSIDTLVQALENMFNKGLKGTNMNISAEFVREYIPTVSEIPDSQKLVESQYDLLYGDWATEKDELLIVVDQYNRITDITMALLGYRAIEGIDSKTYSVQFGGEDNLSFETALNKKFYFIDNGTRYIKISDGSYMTNPNLVTEESLSSLADEHKLELKVKGVVRLKDSVKSGVLQTGIAYTSKLVEHIIEKNKDTEIVQEAKTNPVTVNDVNGSKSMNARQLAGSNLLSKISIYSVDYQAKEEVLSYLDAWNNRTDITEEQIVHYSDSTAMLFTALNTIVDAVKIVLVCFTAISLVVSSIMIGIITYVSVVERTKEIGVLRSIGARKKDISRIFNAETFLIGLFAGLIGVGVTYLLTIPINLIIGSLIENVGNIAMLKITDALLLVAISFVLTLIAGLVPSRIAANKDPVVALRTE